MTRMRRGGNACRQRLTWKKTAALAVQSSLCGRPERYAQRPSWIACSEARQRSVNGTAGSVREQLSRHCAKSRMQA